ncbi:MAG TPA: PadR family transcriptional regulator [Acidimicrobiales bacterium]|nr:PadR family transcriptional regulator [Acidimicrobiales bacterium]
MTLVADPWEDRAVALRDSLSLNEWAVLACLVERPRHGYDIAAALDAATDLGTVWRVPRQFVYRALDRLHALGLASPRRQEPGEGGPPRQVYAATAQGRLRLDRWLAEPVQHLREVRSELLLKLVLGRRLGVDPRPLVEAQRDRFAPALDALAVPPPGDDPVALWRHHSAAAVAAFLENYSTNSSDAPTSA